MDSQRSITPLINSPNPSVNWEAETQSDIGYGQLFSIFWRRRFLFLAVFFGVLGVSVPLALKKKPVYRSYMSILAEPNYQGKSSSNLEPEFTDTNVEIDYSTQLQVLRSTEILRRAIDKLGLQLSPEMETAFIAELKANIAVSQALEENGTSKYAVPTDIIQVSYNGDSSSETQRVLEAIREVYIEYNTEQQEERLVKGLTFINAQIPEARKNLVKAEADLTELREQNNLIFPEEEAVALRNSINNISSERATLQAQQRELRGNSSSLKNQIQISEDNAVVLSRLSQSPRYQNLLNELQQIELNLATERARFTEDSPVVQELLRTKENQKQLLLQEAERVLGTVPPNLFAQIDSLQKQGQLVTSDTKFLDNITQSEAALRGLRNREASLAQTQERLKQKLRDFPQLIAEFKSLSQEVEVKRAALQQLLEAKQEIEIELSRGGFSWQVVEPPQLGVQVAPNVSQDLMLSLVVASFLGSAAVLLKETVDDKVSSTKEIEKQTALPLLGTTPSHSFSAEGKILNQIPFLPRTNASSLSRIVQWGPFRESLDLIYENFKLSDRNSQLKSIAITSPTPGEGKSTFTLGLALSVARRGQKVLVIDGDLRCPSTHEAFKLENDLGLANFLAQKPPTLKVRKVKFGEEQIDLITSGTIPRDPVKLLSSSLLQELIQQQKQHYDLILVDTPPVIGMVDALKISASCDGTILLTRLEKVKSTELSEARSLLSRFNVLGVVANDSREVAKSYETKPQYVLPQKV